MNCRYLLGQSYKQSAFAVPSLFSASPCVPVSVICTRRRSVRPTALARQALDDGTLVSPRRDSRRHRNPYRRHSRSGRLGLAGIGKGRSRWLYAYRPSRPTLERLRPQAAQVRDPHVETINERHGAPFPGRHARYVLRSVVRIVSTSVSEAAWWLGGVAGQASGSIGTSDCTTGCYEVPHGKTLGR